MAQPSSRRRVVLARRLLTTGLDARRAVRPFDGLGDKDGVAAFAAAVSRVSASDTASLAALDGVTPKANSTHTGHTRTMDGFVGHGGGIVRDARAGGNWRQPAERFGGYYNRSVDDFASCQRDEARARP